MQSGSLSCDTSLRVTVCHTQRAAIAWWREASKANLSAPAHHVSIQHLTLNMWNGDPTRIPLARNDSLPM